MTVYIFVWLYVVFVLFSSLTFVFILHVEVFVVTYVGMSFVVHLVVVVVVTFMSLHVVVVVRLVVVRAGQEKFYAGRFFVLVVCWAWC